jgi:hypothetical protein
MHLVAALKSSPSVGLIRTKFSACVGLLGILTAALSGQSPPPPIEAHLRIVSLDLPILDHGFITGGKFKPTTIGTGTLTADLTYHGPARFELLKTADVGAVETTPNNSAGTKGPPRTPTWWVDLPAGKSGQHLILLVSQPNDKGGIIAMPDDPTTFGYGTHRYMNFCPYPISVKVPAGVFPIPPQTFKTFRSGVKGGAYYSLEIKSFENGEEKLGFATRVLQSESFRKIYILYPGLADTGRIKIKVIEDQPAAKPLQSVTEVPAPKGK